MKNRKSFFILTVLLVFAVGGFYYSGIVSAQKVKRSDSYYVLYDKSLAEIQEYMNGKWILVSGQNGREVCEYDDTFIEFNGDKYVWIEESQREPGNMNWRKDKSPTGLDTYLMDVFYAEHPAYPIAVNGDTLFLQDCSNTGYKYILMRK